MNDQTPSDDSEVGRFSIWFLRGAVVLTALVVAGFLVHATLGLFDQGEEVGESDTPGEPETSTPDDELTGETPTTPPTTSTASPTGSTPDETTTSLGTFAAMHARATATRPALSTSCGDPPDGDADAAKMHAPAPWSVDVSSAALALATSPAAAVTSDRSSEVRLMF